MFPHHCKVDLGLFVSARALLHSPVSVVSLPASLVAVRIPVRVRILVRVRIRVRVRVRLSARARVRACVHAWVGEDVVHVVQWFMWFMVHVVQLACRMTVVP